MPASRREHRARQEAERAARAARIWTATAEQAQYLRDAFEAGPEGKYVSLTDRIASCLVDGGCGDFRVKHIITDVPRSVHDRRVCEYDEYYFVPNAYGLSLIGISPWPPGLPGA
jgi:hypothetical protein